jgi:methionine synthase II (cobalamin-independent)
LTTLTALKPPRITHQKKKALLEHYAESGNISASTQAAGVNRHTHYDWLRADADYAAAFSAAKDTAVDCLEAEARRRAKDGWEEPVYHQGIQVGLVRKYSDTLLIFLLKGARPDVYKDRREVTGAEGGPVVLRVRGPTDE